MTVELNLVDGLHDSKSHMSQNSAMANNFENGSKYVSKCHCCEWYIQALYESTHLVGQYKSKPDEMCTSASHTSHKHSMVT